MPIKKAAFKYLRQTEKKTARNAKVKAEMDFLLRKSRNLLKQAKLSEADEQIKKAVSALDKAWQNGVMKKNTVARLKSRLMKSRQAAAAKG